MYKRLPVGVALMMKVHSVPTDICDAPSCFINGDGREIDRTSARKERPCFDSGYFGRIGCFLPTTGENGEISCGSMKNCTMALDKSWNERNQELNISPTTAKPITTVLSTTLTPDVNASIPHEVIWIAAGMFLLLLCCMYFSSTCLLQTCNQKPDENNDELSIASYSSSTTNEHDMLEAIPVILITNPNQPRDSNELTSESPFLVPFAIPVDRLT